MQKQNSMLKTFADRHAKVVFPEPEYILDKIEFEQRILDVFEDIKAREYMTFDNYQELIYLKIPFLNMLSEYRKVDHKLALELIKQENVTYENLENIFMLDY